METFQKKKKGFTLKNLLIPKTDTKVSDRRDQFPDPPPLIALARTLKRPPLYQRFPSSNKMQVWSQRCPVGCPWKPQNRQNAAPGYPMASPGYQNDKLFNTLGNLRVGGMRRQPGKFMIVGQELQRSLQPNTMS